MKKEVKQYLIISFGWTWSLWIIAYLISRFVGHTLITDIDIFHLFHSKLDATGLIPQIIFALAVYGPMIGYLFSKKNQTFFGNPKAAVILLSLILPITMILPTLVISFISGQSRGQSFSWPYLLSIALYFISNLFTSGTEEFGWRGFLYPALRDNYKTFWDSAWRSGLIWAVWHYPLMFIIYYNLGLFVLVPTLIGFTASIVAMTYITNYIYKESESILLCMVLHALNNTASFAVMLLFPKTPFVFLTALIAWAFVVLIEKKRKP